METKNEGKKKAPSKKKAAEEPEKPHQPGVLETVAKAIGTTLGEVAVKTGVVHPPKKKVGKLQPKNKKRLPRKLKKRMQKEKASAK
jgi:hypothetical protein